MRKILQCKMKKDTNNDIITEKYVYRERLKICSLDFGINSK